MTNTFQSCITSPKYGGLDFNRLRSGPFEGPAIVIPPALPEDTYFISSKIMIGMADSVRCLHVESSIFFIIFMFICYEDP